MLKRAGVDRHRASSGRVDDKSVSCPEPNGRRGPQLQAPGETCVSFTAGEPMRLIACCTTVKRISLHPLNRGNPVPKPNYRQAKKQKELSRKARQLEKQQRRTARANDSGEVATPSQDPAVGPSNETLSSGT